MSNLKKCQQIMEERGKSYGKIEDGFYKTSSILEHAFDILLTPAEIAKVQVALKLARNCNKYKKDNVIDMINYIDIADQLE